MKKDMKDLNNNFIAMSDFHINLPIIFKKLQIKNFNYFLDSNIYFISHILHTNETFTKLLLSLLTAETMFNSAFFVS